HISGTSSANVTMGLDSAGMATLPAQDLLPGSYTITADYNGDTNFAASTSAPLSQVISKVVSTTTVSAAPASPSPSSIVAFRITGHPPAFTNSTSATFTFAGTDNLTPAANLTFQVSLDGSAFAPSANPLALTNLTVGTHTLAARAVDQAGNVDPTGASFTWAVD